MSNSLQESSWSAEEDILVSTTDLVSYVFGRCQDYDLEKPIFVDANDSTKSVSARQALKLVRQLVKGFQDQGLQKGDCVCLHSYNDISYPLLWLGTLGAAGCVAGSNPSYTTSELLHVLKTTAARFIVSHFDCLTAITEAAAQCQIPKQQIFVIGAQGRQLPDGCHSWQDLLNRGESNWTTYDQDKEDLGDVVALLALTSGTTGLPKAAALSHRALVAQCELMLKYKGKREYQESRLICLPIFHAFALPLGILFPLRQGTTTYFLPRFKLDSFVNAIHAYSITETAVVPPIITALLKLDSTQVNYLRALKYIICAGAPMNADVQARLYDQLSSTAIIAQCWGMTEVGWASAFPSDEKDTSGSVGRLLPNVELKIVDETGQVVTQEGRRGEACLRSPGLFNGYHNDPGATSSSFDAEGFYWTGDRVFVAGGKIFIDGRVKEIMKVKGWQVAPAELENVLRQHPEVLDAAVTGIDQHDADGVEEVLPQAFVVRRTIRESEDVDTEGEGSVSGASDVSSHHLVTADDLMAFVSSKVVSYKRLTGGVKFVEHIPRSNTGKILRRLLAE